MSEAYQLPNFFLVGAPKCGTTSVASWLSEHPDVFMCTPKEPNFFSTDIGTERSVLDWDDYRQCFREAHPRYLAVGEASTTYLRSDVAVPAILDSFPEAKFIVCLRNPADMVASWHGQLVRGGREDQRDLAVALSLESERRAGRRLPPFTREPKDLLYRDHCALGKQLARILELVPRERVHLIFLDDLKASSAEVWRQLQTFLGVPDDGRRNFGVENSRAMPRWPWLTRLFRLSFQVKYLLLPRRSLGLGSTVARLLERSPKEGEAAVPDELRGELSREFAEDIRILEACSGRDLSSWRQAPEADLAAGEDVGRPVRVVQFTRRPYPSAFSIERVFADIRQHLPRDVVAENFESGYFSKGFVPRLMAMIQAARNQADVNHVTGDVHFLTIFLSRRRTVLTIHDCATYQRLRGLKRLVYWVLWLWLPIHRSEVVTVISEFTRQQLMDITGAPRGKVRVVPNPLPGGFSYQPRAFPQKTVTVLHVGTKANKNLERHIQALRGLDVTMIVVGPLTEHQRNALKSADIQYRNPVGISQSEIIACYESADILLFVSTTEGFGLPILEAQAVGRPVVTSREEPMASVAGDGALLVDPYDTDAIRGAVMRLLREPDLREQLVLRGRENARRFDAEVIAESYAQIYRQLGQRP